jgi:hypothetical protein
MMLLMLVKGERDGESIRKVERVRVVLVMIEEW